VSFEIKSSVSYMYTCLYEWKGTPYKYTCMFLYLKNYLEVLHPNNLICNFKIITVVIILIDCYTSLKKKEFVMRKLAIFFKDLGLRYIVVFL